MMTSRWTIKNYTIERIQNIDDINGELAAWFIAESDKLARIYGNKFNHKNFDFLAYARGGLFLVCRRDGKPVGILLARLYGSIFDPSLKILFQDSLYVSEGGGRAAHLLLREFIDFGKSNANHILTHIALKTNIKRRSLEKLGFEKIEELYRIEVGIQNE